MRRSLTPWIALAAALVLTLAFSGIVISTGRGRDEARFRHAVASASDRIESRFELYQSFLLQTAALLGTDAPVDATTFRQFIERSRVRERYPGLQAVAFARPFRVEETAAIEADLRAAGELRGVWPKGDADGRTAVIWTEPRDERNLKALGFDMLREPIRGEAMARSRDEGRPALTGRLKLVQEIDPAHVQAGFILFVPVFAGSEPPSAVAGRRAALKGWVAAVFRADDLFQGIFGRERPLVDFQVYDGASVDRTALLHDRAAAAVDRRLTSQVRFDIAGRPWTVVFTATPALQIGASQRVGLAVLFAGLLVSALLFLLARREALARERAERAAEQLRDADRRKDEFLAVLGHELRNPLSPMLTALELQARGASEVRVRDIFERQTRHMVRLVDDLLDISRISRGKIELRRAPFEVVEAVRRAVEVLAPLAAERSLRLDVELPQAPVALDGDATRFDQIVGNLLSNALKYTPPGGEVRVSARAQGGDLELRVRDSGIGVAPEMLEELFKPFVQVRDARQLATGGLGIGLALVRALVELHGGTVRAESAGLGKGAEFVVRLPGVREGAAPPRLREARATPPRLRVLLIDDNVDAADTLAEALRMDGVEVRVANDGARGVEEARAFSPRVIILDIGLPDASGYEVVKTLRALPDGRASFIAALTGFGQARDRARALEAGFDEHLVKPVELETVRSLLVRAGGGERREAAAP